MTKLFTLLFFTLLSFAVFSDDQTAQDGNWTTDATWLNGVEPTTDAILIIENGHTATVNSAVIYGTDVTIIVRGVLNMDDGQLILTTNSNIIVDGGTIESNGSFGGLFDGITMGFNIPWNGLANGEIVDGWEINESGISVILPLTWGKILPSYNIDENRILVDWTTYSENNNDFFTIELSDDLENWTDGSYVNGNGNTKFETFYQTDFIHFTNEKVVYIRIKQTDFEGTFDYSNVFAVETHINDSTSKILFYIDLNGEKTQSIETAPSGVYIIIYEDGTREKIHKQ